MSLIDIANLENLRNIQISTHTHINTSYCYRGRIITPINVSNTCKDSEYKIRKFLIIDIHPFKDLAITKIGNVERNGA